MKNSFIYISLFLVVGINASCQRPVTKDKSGTAGANNIDIYLRLGDSNESGGTATEDSSFPAKYHTVLQNAIIYFKPDRTSTNNGSWLNVSDSNPTINQYSGYAAIGYKTPPLGVGPSQSFCYSIDSLSKSKVGIIKCALGGTKLTSEWQSGGSMYNFFFLYSYPVGMLKLTQFNKANIKGVVIRLGTNDCATGYNDATFKAAIPVFVAQIRAATGVSDLPIYWVQVNANLYLAPGGTFTPTNVTAVRAAITACQTVGNPAYIAGFHVLNYDSDALLPDGVHYTQNSCISQGIYEANLMH